MTKIQKINHSITKVKTRCAINNRVCHPPKRGHYPFSSILARTAPLKRKICLSCKCILPGMCTSVPHSGTTTELVTAALDCSSAREDRYCTACKYALYTCTCIFICNVILSIILLMIKH